VRIVVIRLDGANVDMFRWGEGKRLMILWYAELLGWVVCRKQSIEKTVEFASAYIAYVADLHGTI